MQIHQFNKQKEDIVLYDVHLGVGILAKCLQRGKIVCTQYTLIVGCILVLLLRPHFLSLGPIQHGKFLVTLDLFYLRMVFTRVVWFGLCVET